MKEINNLKEILEKKDAEKIQMIINEISKQRAEAEKEVALAAAEKNVGSEYFCAGKVRALIDLQCFMEMEIAK